MKVRCELKALLKGSNYLLLQEGVQHVRGTATGFLFYDYFYLCNAIKELKKLNISHY